MRETGENSDDRFGPQSAFVRAVRGLLRPLVRGLIKRGVQLPQLVEELKALYIDVAHDEAARHGRVTQSALSVMTGVHRKDVKRLMREWPAASSPPTPASLGSKLAGIWMARDIYLEKDGTPKALFERRSDGSPSFEELVEEVSRDVRSRAVLDDWLRLNVVSRRADGKIELNTDAFVSSDGEAEALHFFGRNLRDHVAAGLHNLDGVEPRYIDRAVFYPGLTPASVDKLRQLAGDLGAKAIRDVNREALQLSTRDRTHGDGGQRMTFGVYFYAEPPQDDEQARADTREVPK
ncbi:MAG: DUF6502 family protein [Parvibaculum sp.]